LGLLGRDGEHAGLGGLSIGGLAEESSVIFGSVVATISPILAVFNGEDNLAVLLTIAAVFEADVAIGDVEPAMALLYVFLHLFVDWPYYVQLVACVEESLRMLAAPFKEVCICINQINKI
jgi:hypothetical protein